MKYVLKRKLSVYVIFFLILAIFTYWVYDTYIKEKPNCFDGLQNGIEEGVDCGGTCAEICTFKAEQINVNWTRAFEVVDGVYNIASSIENPNFNYSFDVEYLLKYINQRGLNVGEVKGIVRLQPMEKRIIFIPGVKLPGQKISKVFLESKRIFNLKRATAVDNKIKVNSKEIIVEPNLTKLKLIIENQDFIPKRYIQIFAILFDKEGNAIDINRTYLEYLDKDARAEAFMTWPKELGSEIAEIKVVIKQERLRE